jgi:colanic acid/amylovoran biosynthesis glycosyltransferase
MKQLVYVVSRFPNPSETFVLREVNQLDDSGRYEIELLSLYPPKEHFLHVSGERWLSRSFRPSPAQAALATLRALLRRPLRLLASIGRIVAASWRSPSVAVRSLVTVPLCCAHAERCESRGVGHLHAHFATYPALCAWVCARLTGSSYSYTVHAHDLYVDDSLLKLTLDDAAFVVTISHFNERLIAAAGSSTPVEVIRAGIDTRAYPFRPREVPEDGPVDAVCVASLQEHKGHEVLLEALDHPSLERIRMQLIGDGPLRAGLEAEVRRRGLTDRIAFSGSVEEAGVRGALEAADLFVMASRVARDGQMEGLPVALMEAAASGVPIVATRLSAIPELISDGETGWLAEPGDPIALRGALASALDQRSLDASRLRRLVEKEFDVRAGVERLDRLFGGAGPASPT